MLTWIISFAEIMFNVFFLSLINTISAKFNVPLLFRQNYFTIQFDISILHA